MPESSFYKQRISPLLDQLDSETWHIQARDALHLAERVPFGKAVLRKLFAYENPKLHITVEGIEFENPVLVGAGWDKAGRAVAGLHALGFAGVEVGTIPEHPQEGNPKPRQFMIAPGVAINRLGFNSHGMEDAARNLQAYRDSGIPLGISVGKNKTVSDDEAPQAHARIIERLYDYGSYFVINVSSPNTPGLRGLQDKRPLTQIVQAVQQTMKEKGGQKPLFVKIAPDMTTDAINDVIDVVEQNNLAGIIATNTTVNTDIKGKYTVQDSRLQQTDASGSRRTWADEMGGLSGDDKDYRKMATDVIRHIYEESYRRGLHITIIGVGGVKDGPTALEKIKAGASLVQVVTAIRGEGPAVAGNINRAIAREMKRLRLTKFEDLVGYDVRHRRKTS